MRSFVSFALVLWAAGVVLHEAIEQLAAALVIGAALVAWRRGAAVADDVRPVVRATLWFAAWCAVSPAVAWARGIVGGWPVSGRYGQLEDVVATAAVAVVASGGVPWRAIGWTVGTGWAASFALGVWQHVRWFPYDLSWLHGQDEWRVHQSLDGRRFAAGGFLFHRLRFAHTALAVLGPALGAAFVGGAVRARLGGVLVAACCVGSAYVAFARSALGAMALLVLLAVALLGSHRARLVGLPLAVAGAIALFSLGPVRELVARAFESFDSDRGAAMQLAWEVVRAHPLLGVGFGNHATVAATLVPPGSSWVVAHSAHNTWLQVWSETGLVGVGLFAWFHATLAVALWRRRRGWVAAGALLSWAGFHAASMFHTLPLGSGVMLAFAFAWGLGLAAGVPELQEKHADPEPPTVPATGPGPTAA